MKIDNKQVSTLVQEMETNFKGTTKTSKYVDEDISEDVDTIYAYLNSKHISGETDSKGRRKPFFNIVTSSRNIWYRATDLDRKNVHIKPTKNQDVIPAFVATVILKEWMNKESFGVFLNKWGMELAGFNSSVVKFIETKGKLKPTVVPWGRIICDVIDFDGNPKIEILQLTPAQLKMKGYDSKQVDKLIEAQSSRELLDGQKQDNKDNYIKLYEIHGKLSKSYLTGLVRDKNVFVQQMHVLSFVATDDGTDNHTLYSGKEANDPYLLTSLMPSTDGSISLNGSVKTLFQAQWMINHTMKSIKDQMDIASKLIFQTSDGGLSNRNVLTSIEQGDVLIHALNQPITQVNNTSHDIGTQESFGNMWKGLANEIAGVSESMLGQTAPSGTAWRQVQAILNESHSLFELMRQNKGLDLERMMRIFIIPFIKKQISNSDEITTVLEQHDITKIDEMFVPYEAVRRYNQDAIKTILSGKTPNPFDQQQAQQQVKDQLALSGNQRFFKPSDISTTTWKDVLKDLEWRVEIDVTGESVNNQDVLTTLSTALNAVANPNYENNPQAQLVVSKILQATDVISPLELAVANRPPPQSVNNVKESMAFKDLPPEGQQQMAAQAGIKIQPPAPAPTPQPTQLPTKP